MATKGRSCDGKKRHDTREGAKIQFWRLVNTTGTARNRICVYPCGHCGGWHIGHKQKPRRTK